MKKTAIIPALILSLTIFFSPLLKAQECDFFMPFKENSGLKYQNFNQRDRLEGSQEVRVKKVETNGGELVATIHTKAFDRRDRLQHEGEYTIICDGDEMIIDMKSMLNQAMQGGDFQEMDMRFESENIVLPSRMTPGQQLPDASMQMVIQAEGMNVSTTNMRIFDRQVESKETITTPAGTFECFKISSNMNSETRAMGIPFRVNARTVEYYAPNVGMVRTEHYDDKGRLQGYTVLAEIL
jgi:hypothetical protein